MHASIVSRLESHVGIRYCRAPCAPGWPLQNKDTQREIDFRVSVLTFKLRRKSCFAYLDKAQANLDLKKLGFSDHALEILAKVSLLPTV